jgi:glycosyltransferase involved in cell wall biosynthesis
VIIPSKGRDRLKFSLYSLLSQTNSNWNCIVAFDNVDKDKVLTIDDDRIKYLYLPQKVGNGNNGGGEVRNQAINQACTEWLCFLDDDDTFCQDYIDSFYDELSSNPEMEVCIFKMIYENGVIRPPDGLKKLVIGQVGISFAVKLKFLNENNLRFVNGEIEDYTLLKKLESAGANFVFSNKITYNVGFSSL